MKCPLLTYCALCRPLIFLLFLDRKETFYETEDTYYETQPCLDNQKNSPKPLQKHHQSSAFDVIDHHQTTKHQGGQPPPPPPPAPSSLPLMTPADPPPKTRIEEPATNVDGRALLLESIRNPESRKLKVIRYKKQPRFLLIFRS